MKSFDKYMLEVAANLSRALKDDTSVARDCRARLEQVGRCKRKAAANRELLDMVLD